MIPLTNISYKLIYIIILLNILILFLNILILYNNKKKKIMSVNKSNSLLY